MLASGVNAPVIGWVDCQLLPAADATVEEAVLEADDLVRTEALPVSILARRAFGQDLALRQVKPQIVRQTHARFGRRPLWLA